MKTYKIFLASSSELKADRKEFEIALARLNDDYVRQNKHVHFDLYSWERESEAVFDTRKQDQYNQNLDTCDLFVLLFWTKVGKYTDEEFDTALRRFRATQKPLLFTYKRTTSVNHDISEADSKSREVFEEKLLNNTLHFTGSYAHPIELTGGFRAELDKLFAKGYLEYGEMARCLSAGQPAVPEGFIGRRDELNTIRQRMDEGGTLMLINSEGGMGKTSIAAKYWKENLYRYTHNAWLFCENGIVGEMMKLAPALNLDLAKIPESQHVAAMRTTLQNLPADCLLVLDNANNPDDIEAFRQDFSGLHWHVLITSRCQNVLEKQQELFIEHLPPGLAKELFTSYYNEHTPEFENLLDQLLSAIGYNTLIIELFAKNMAELAALGETLADFLRQLEETKSLFLGERSFEVITPYTATTHKKAATTDQIIDALYDLTKLTEADRFRLVNMALLPAESHLLTILIKLFAPDDKFTLRNELAGLAQRGWLTTDTKSYRLSPVVQKIVLAKNKDRLWNDGKGLVERLNYFFEDRIADGSSNYEKYALANLAKVVAANTHSLELEINELYHKLCLYFNSVGILSEALSCAFECIKISQLRGDSFNLANALGEAGNIFFEYGSISKAIQYNTKQLSLIRVLSDENPHNDVIKFSLAKAYCNLAKIYEIKGYSERTINLLNAGLGIFIDLYFDYPSNKDYAMSLAAVSSQLGTFAKAQGKIENALSYFQSSLNIDYQLYTDNPHHRAYIEHLAIAYSNVGEILSVKEDFEESLSFYNKSHSLFQELYNIDEFSIRNRRNLGVSHERISDVCKKQNDLNKALYHITEAIKLFEALYAIYTDLEDIKNGLGIVYEKCGMIYYLLGNLNKSLHFLDERNKLAEELHRSNPQRLEFSYALATSYIWLGLVLQSNSSEKALEQYTKAVPILESLCAFATLYDQGSIPKYQGQLNWVISAIQAIQN